MASADIAHEPVFLGIDLGTSAVKALLVDRAQQVIAAASLKLAISRPRPGWSEQAPEDWWKAVCAVIAELGRMAPAAMREVAAVGLSGQMHGLVMLDAANRVRYPAMLWNDQRATREAEAIAAEQPGWAEIAGAAQSPSFWPAKLRWLQRHEPEMLADCRKLLPPKDYLRWRMTGRFCTDPCDAGGTLLFDAQTRAWSAPILAGLGIAAALLPTVVEGNQRSGALLPAIADAWGIAGRAVIVAGGGGDAATGAIGIGAVRDGDAFISLGTSAQLSVMTASYRPAVAASLQSFAHGLPGLWFQAGAVLNGASALAWATRLFGEPDPIALLDAAEATDQGPGALLFLPYLSGERTPHNDPQARGVLFGLTPDSQAPQIIQAVLEGVAYALADALGCIAQAGTRIERAAIVGGGARSAFWTRIIADVTGITVTRYCGTETGPAFGAARLARMALTGEAADEICTVPPILDETRPDASRHVLYRREHERFRSLYQALRPEFHRPS